MIELTLPDISCGHCVKVVTEAVKRIDPQARVEVELLAKQVRIDSSADPQVLRQALADEGYPAAG